MTEDTHPRLVVTADLPCRRCRYHLRGQETTGRCPECGLAIEETLRSSIDLASLAGFASPGVSRLRLLAGSAMLGLAVAAAALAGLLMPLALVTAPTGFDPAGPDDAAIVGTLAPAILGLGIAGAIAGTLGLGARLTLGPATSLGRATRSLPIAIGLLGIVAAAGLGSSVLSAERSATALAVVGSTVEVCRALATAFLAVGVAAVLTGIGSRSERYTREGLGRQGLAPFVASTAVVVLAAVGWLGLALTGIGGQLHRFLAAIPWDLLWMIGGTIAALGAIYLAMNLIWAMAPWRRADARLGALVGSSRPGVRPARHRAAGMADDAPDEPSA